MSKKKDGANSKTEREQSNEERLQFSEDLIFYSTILNTISSAMGLIGVCIAREISKEEEGDETEEDEATAAQTFFADVPMTGGSIVRGGLRSDEAFSNHLYEHMKQMRRELDHVNWQVKKMQDRLEKWR